MANENLEGFEQRSESGLMSPGMLVVVIMFFLTFIAWGGSYYYSRDLTSKIQELNKDNEAYIGQSIMTNEAKKVADFQLRLAQAEELMPQGRNLFDSFRAIENSILSTVYLNSFEFDDKNGTIKLSASTDNFTNVALQVFSLKKSEFFSDVKMDEAHQDKNGNKVRFIMTLKLK